MRINEEESLDCDLPAPGSLLVAHPSLIDSNFKQSVVFLTVHDPDGGSLGVIVNRALGKTLGDYDPDLSNSALSHVPLYEGGPVASDKLILAAWKWIPEDSTFRLYFGIDGDKAKRILQEDPDFQIRGFLGHAGWSEGQLDAEIEQGAWVLSQWSPELEARDGDEVWRDILCHVKPELSILVDVPEDPSRN